MARRGRPQVIYSDNGSTFIKTSKWLRQLCKDEHLQGLLDECEINWKFNLSHAPWWGAKFERLIRVVKSAVYKVIGGGALTWDELSEVLLDVETQINRRPLSYVKEDVELPILTPSSFLFQCTNRMPEKDTWRIRYPDLRKILEDLQGQPLEMVEKGVPVSPTRASQLDPYRSEVQTLSWRCGHHQD